MSPNVPRCNKCPQMPLNVSESILYSFKHSNCALNKAFGVHFIQLFHEGRIKKLKKIKEDFKLQQEEMFKEDLPSLIKWLTLYDDYQHDSIKLTVNRCFMYFAYISVYMYENISLKTICTLHFIIYWSLVIFQRSTNIKNRYRFKYLDRVSSSKF